MAWVVLSDVLDETGDSAEGGEAPAADTDGVGSIASSDSRVVEPRVCRPRSPDRSRWRAA